MSNPWPKKLFLFFLSIVWIVQLPNRWTDNTPEKRAKISQEEMGVLLTVGRTKVSLLI